ncbi:GTPase [Cellulomonas fimi]|uniref:GTP-binding protein n=1 Tax=Cellulomonas fimi TaxID=1708 RepID=A0A7Y0LYC9_CELFI|nr:GTPase [Cellulomonas fimi]NMR20456.1 GTP-binding protein [Cellulomonas fimi]
MATLDSPDQFDDAYDEQTRELGTVRIAIFGGTGVGKSTLINAVFGEDVAAAGVGEPVTKGVHKHVNAEGTLAIWDFQGFETGDKPSRWLRKQVADNRRGSRQDTFDVAWFAVSGPSGRFDDGQAALVRELDTLGIPVVLVLTQVHRRGEEFAPAHLELAASIEARDLPIVSNKVVLARATPDPFSGLPSHGLQDLLDRTYTAVPQGRLNALIASQRIDLRSKLRLARSWIAGASTFAGGVGFVPVPVADAGILVPAQMALMARIAAIYNVPKDQARKVITGATSVATMGGKYAATSLFKLVPGVGSVISASVAATITATVGESWRTVSENVFTGKLDLDAVSDVAASFLDGLRRKVKTDGEPAA